MNRRALLIAGSAWLAAAATRSFAQAPKVPRRIAFLHPGREAGNRERLSAFRAALQSLGYAEGPEFSIDTYWADDRTSRLDSLVAQALSRNPAVVVTASSTAVAAFKKATSTVPIVFATGSTPVEQGFVASLRRPGGNITGIIFHQDLEGKLVEIVREALPVAQRLGVLIHEPDAVHKIHLASIEPVARRLRFELVIARVSGVEEFEGAFKALAARKADALLLPSQVLFSSRIDEIASRALKARLPVFSPHSNAAEGGGLVSYGTLAEENYRRAAAMVDKILRGAKPGDIPVEQPERFQLVVNMKTAKAIGVSLSPAFMQRADKVIE